jgi:hypothetical protein
LSATPRARQARGDGRENDALFGIALFALALAPRLYVALAWSGEPVWDGHYYDFGARRIASGLGYSDDLTIAGQTVWHPWCHYPVGYSAFLAGFYRLMGASHAAAAIANALTGAALAVVTWLLAREALSTWRARAAGLIVALHPGMVLYAALVMTEPLAALLTLGAFWVAVRDGNRTLGVVMGALVLGVAALVRPQALLCAPVLGLLPLRRHSEERSDEEPPSRLGGSFATLRMTTMRVLTVCAITLVPVLPWTVRNCRVMDGCALVSTNGGWNLAIGSFPRATGRFETLRSSDGCREVTGQVQQDRCWFAYGTREIAEHPMRWLALIPAKLGFTFDHESFAVEYLREARPDSWPETRRVFARSVTTFAHRLLLFAAAFGCVALHAKAAKRKGTRVQVALLGLVLLLVAVAVTAESPSFWPLAIVCAVVPWLPLPGAPDWPWALRLPVALLASTVLVHAVFFGEDRYHIVVTPVLALLAAAAFRPAKIPAS